jgi:hypothetical protein
MYPGFFVVGGHLKNDHRPALRKDGLHSRYRRSPGRNFPPKRDQSLDWRFCCKTRRSRADALKREL